MITILTSNRLMCSKITFEKPKMILVVALELDSCSWLVSLKVVKVIRYILLCLEHSRSKDTVSRLKPSLEPRSKPRPWVSRLFSHCGFCKTIWFSFTPFSYQTTWWEVYPGLSQTSTMEHYAALQTFLSILDACGSPWYASVSDEINL